MTDPIRFIGIDPGVNTGVALSCKARLRDVLTMSAVEAEQYVLKERDIEPLDLIVVFEDARLRKWFGNAGREVLQGAGSIKRDCGRWEEFLSFHNIHFMARAPQKGGTKMDAERFNKLTGWTGRTSEHARDAALLVWGK